MKKEFLTLALAVFLVSTVFSQKSQIPLIGSTAPSFTAQSTNGTVTFPDDYGKK